jgi:2-polyprenyl-3-methyl-5-hydroxy-6-metoxy-1,4-benzoquinol methylase
MSEPDQIPAGSSAFPETADIETSSDEYAARFAGPAGEWMLAVQERITLGLLARGSYREILDVGGGHGQLAIPMCRAGYEVTVLGSAESCRARLAGALAGGRCRFAVGNVIALPYPDRSFDTVVCFRLLTHCERWPALVAELCRVSRGVVIADYPVHHGIHRLAPRLFEAKKRVEKNTRTWRPFAHAEVDDAFRAHGYSVRSRRAQFFLPMVIHRRLRNRAVSTFLEAACRMCGLTRLWGSPAIVERGREPRAAPACAAPGAPSAP